MTVVHLRRTTMACYWNVIYVKVILVVSSMKPINYMDEEYFLYHTHAQGGLGMRLTKCCIVLFKFFTTTDLTSLWVVSTILLGLITCSVVLYSNLWSQCTLKLVFRWRR